MILSVFGITGVARKKKHIRPHKFPGVHVNFAHKIPHFQPAHWLARSLALAKYKTH